MITRRDLVKWGIVAPVLAGVPAMASGQVPEGLDALVIDRRLVAAGGGGFGAPVVHTIDGDVTALWYEVLDPVWRRPGFVLGGVTGRDALFVLETLAPDRGRRVVSRRPLPPPAGRDAGPIAWIIAPVHPSVRA